MKKLLLLILVCIGICGNSYADTKVEEAEVIVEYNFNSDRKVHIHNPYDYQVIVSYSISCATKSNNYASSIIASKSVILEPNQNYTGEDGYGSIAKDGGEYIFAYAGADIFYYYIQLKAYKLDQLKQY